MLAHDTKMDIFQVILILIPVLLMLIPSLANRIFDTYVKFNNGRKTLIWLFPVTLYTILFGATAGNLIALIVFVIMVIGFAFIYSAAISALIILMKQE